jgi:spore germination protein KA
MVNKNNSLKLTNSLKNNISIIKNIFTNDDTIIFRKFESIQDLNIEFCLVFEKNMSDLKFISGNIIEPILNHELPSSLTEDTAIDYLIKKVLISPTNLLTSDINEIVDSVLLGNVILFISGVNQAVIIPSKGFEERSIATSDTEKAVRGPKDAFTESLDTNLTLIRKRLPDKDLKFIFKRLGSKTKTQICICYIEGIASEKILNEIIKRLDDIKIDGVIESSFIAENITDNPLSIFGTIGSTERPDNVVAKLLNGRIGIVCNGTPFVLTAPFVFMEYFKITEDYNLNYFLGTINRLLRIVGFFLTTSTPAIYLAIIVYHQEMIPTTLAISIASSRQGVPFPTIIEMLVFLFIFETIREASVRLPTPIGQTVSITGALVIGQAAVEAKLISSPMVIIVNFTGITSFLIVELKSASIALRLIYILCSYVMGLYGYIFGVCGLLFYLVSLRSFGVPYTYRALAIDENAIKDAYIRVPSWYVSLRSKIAIKRDKSK